jgi:hypothetical protein
VPRQSIGRHSHLRNFHNHFQACEFLNYSRGSQDLNLPKISSLLTAEQQQGRGTEATVRWHARNATFYWSSLSFSIRDSTLNFQRLQKPRHPAAPSKTEATQNRLTSSFVVRYGLEPVKQGSTWEEITVGLAPGWAPQSPQLRAWKCAAHASQSQFPLTACVVLPRADYLR